MKVNKLIALAGALVLSLSSCHNPVYDYEGDCEVKYRLRFVYDMNLKWADAFPSEVRSVNLYVFDSRGLFLTEFTDNTQAVNEPGYTMDLDLPAGDYTLVAWCGLGRTDVSEESFTVAAPVRAQTTLEELTCSLNAQKDAQGELNSDTQLNFLYQGNMTVNLPDSQDGSEYLYTMYLTKDTNHIRIILQHLSATDMNPEDYGFSITAADAVMGYDNAIVSDEEVTYTPWEIEAGEAALGKEDAAGNVSLVYANGVIADLSVARMMAEQKDDMMLTITDTANGRVIATVPLIHYALLSKGYYEQAYGHSMTDQEFLDREDEYVLTFFLDENNRWLDSTILIHSWRIVLHNYGV